MSLPKDSPNEETEEGEVPLFQGLRILGKIQPELDNLQHRLECPLLYKTSEDIEKARQVIIKAQNDVTSLNSNLMSMIEDGENFIAEKNDEFDKLMERNNKCMERFRAVEKKMIEFGYNPPTEEDLIQFRGKTSAINLDYQSEKNQFPLKVSQIEKEQEKIPQSKKRSQNAPALTYQQQQYELPSSSIKPTLEPFQVTNKNIKPKLEPHQVRILEQLKHEGNKNKINNNNLTTQQMINPPQQSPQIKSTPLATPISSKNDVMTPSTTPFSFSKRSLSTDNLRGRILADSSLLNSSINSPSLERLPGAGRKYSPYPVKMTLAGPIPGSQSNIPKPIINSPKYLSDFRFGTPIQEDKNAGIIKMSDLTTDEKTIFEDTPQIISTQQQKTPLVQPLLLLPRTDLVSEEEYLGLPNFLKNKITMTELNTALSQASISASNDRTETNNKDDMQIAESDFSQLVGSESKFSAIKLSLLKLKRIEEAPTIDTTFNIS